MRKRFEVQLPLGKIPIERVVIPTKSRDEMPAILGQLQWLFRNPKTNNKVFALIEQKLSANKQRRGRRGMDLWHILVLGMVRVGLDCDYDRLEYLANYDNLLRQILGLSPVQGPDEKPFRHGTLAQNVGYVNDELWQEINAILVAAGRPPFKKKENAADHKKKAA